jgi:hypothetical protein
MAMPLPETNFGRRIYVHEFSFQQLAARCPSHRHQILVSLASAWTKRIVGHHLEAASDIGAVDQRAAQEISDFLHQWWASQTAQLFRRIAHRLPSGERRPLLTQDEDLVATCFESGYYTFATSALAAQRMFDDHEPLHELYASLSSGNGPEDLEMIRGDRLRLIASCEGNMWELGALTSADYLCDLVSGRIKAAIQTVSRAGDNGTLEDVVNTASRLTHRAIERRLTWRVA